MNISTAKGELEGILHGTTLNKVQNINGVFNRAGRQLLMDIDPQETKRIVQMANPIYDSVYDYAVPTDLKGNKIVDIRPQVARNLMDNFSQEYNKDFDLNKEIVFQNNFTINFNNAIKTIRINAPLINTGITVNGASTITGNGTWSGGAGVSNIKDDNFNWAAGGSSVSFDVDAQANAYIENSTFSAIDLTDHYLVSSIFYYVYLPTASNFTSVSIEWGNDDSNYWMATSTESFYGTAFQNGWNLLSADWSSASAVGNPDKSAVNFLRITFNYNSTAMAGVKINSIVSRVGKIYEMEYYSKYLFRNVSTGAFKETVTDNSDLINLDTETFNVYLPLTALYAVQQSIGNVSTYDTEFFQDMYDKNLAKYKEMYKSEIIKPKSMYYKKPSTSWRKYLGRGWNY